MTESVTLWNGEIPYLDPAADTPNRMTMYLLDTEKPIPAVVVLPGGGYSCCPPEEGEGAPVARFYSEHGFQTFVVTYRVKPNRAPAPLADAQRAIRLVRANAAAWGVDPDRIFVCGFSAGGHLAACTATLPDVAQVGDPIDAVSCRPNGAILCYPVISSDPAHGHMDSFINLLGDRLEQERAAYAIQDRVDENTCPCFLWHTAEDECVPVVHSLEMAKALAAHHVPYELHVFRYGRHGLSLAADDPDVGRWPEWSVQWLRTFME